MMKEKANMTTDFPKKFQPSEEGVKAFLESSYIKGIGKVFAERIVEKTGTEILKPDFDFTENLKGIQGLSESKIEEVKDSFSKLKYSPYLLAFLYSTGLNDIDVDKITSHYKKHIYKVLEEDPYQMVEEVFKLSFFSADKIGRYLGIAKDDPHRLQGALVTAVRFSSEEGNLFATEEEALTTASRITGVEKEKILPQIEMLTEEERVVRSHGGLYLPVFYKAEKEVSEKLAERIKGKIAEEVLFPVPDKDRFGNALSQEQKEAIKTVLSHPVTIITGGPGTGKTTTIRGVVKLLEDLEKKVVLAAPTGKAAKRLADLSEREATTLHRLMGYTHGKGYRNKNIDIDFIIIDEASMLEQVMFNHLLNALKPDTRIVLVGDTDQLPPIGAGDVLKDMIQSGTVPVVTLNENFRQQEGSMIAANARAIKEGGKPLEVTDSDFMIISEETSKKIHNRLIKLVAKELPDKNGVSPKDIQVVTPQQEGPLGAKQLNIDIQEAVNGQAPGIRHGSKTFRMGDRVMQTSNSSERHIYNGETGWVSEIDPEGEWLRVTFYDGKTSRYGKKELKELTLAYAITVHKLQGSETDYMVMPISMSHRPMLYRNLLYTGVSRARKLCVLVGEEKALRTAIDNPSPSLRHSNFKKRLRENLPVICK